MKSFLFILLTVLLLSSPASQMDLSMEHSKTDKAMTEYATFGGGCFWCTEAIFSRLKGVESVLPGYSGGTVKNPSYKEVCTGRTGHAEVIQIRFNPAEVSFLELMEVFFATHDPTTLNRQGADVGTQYRSVIFYHTNEQRDQAEKIISDLNREKVWDAPVITEVVPFEAFFPAEEYHQDYYNNNSNTGYCRMVIQPKLQKLEKVFGEKLR